MVLTCYVLTVVSSVTALLMPCIWFFGVPMAAGSLVMAIYLTANYKQRGGVVACIAVSALVLLLGLARAAEVNELLRQMSRER